MSRHLSSEADVSIACRRLSRPAEEIGCAVVVPTFRRPQHLVATLDSLAEQQSATPFAIVVVENDAAGNEGAEAAAAWLKCREIAGLIVVAHSQGNCHAYNAGWSVALRTFPNLLTLAVIDDDEIADAGWLAALHRTAETSGADLVGGPQLPVFGAGPEPRRARHPVFRPPYEATGPVPILYSSGNVLIRRRVLEAMPRPFLDPAFNFIGGGDSDFYRRAGNAGFSFSWAADAVVRETMPPLRAGRGWLTARGLRNGAISTMLEKRQRPGRLGRLRVLAHSAALLATALPRGVLLGLRTGSAFAGLYHLHVALGRFQAEFGRVNEQYRNPESF